MHMKPVNQARDLFFPLDQFYQADHLSFPLIERIDGADMPQPFRRLLVHQGDMTPTLEAYHGSRISLRLFDKKVTREHISRRVALVLDSNRTAVEFGAITIHLRRFSEVARRHVLECHRPLGTIVNEDGIEHYSRPIAFFRVMSDDLINETLGLTDPRWLYGRQNVIYTPDNERLAEVIEILPPLTEPAG